ncbi:MAG: hypothetical protein HGN29_01390 [Asgard group archaeon]|nr:hypothetical protein [Asgard group archaeon]
MKFIAKIIIQIGIVLGFIGTVVVNALSSVGLINNVDPGTLSDNIPNFFVPSGLTFSIWGVIYIGLAALAVYSTVALFKKREEESYFLNKMGIEFIVASIANITWIFLWHYQTPANYMVEFSLVAMVILLAALLTMYIRLGIGKEEVSKKEKWFVHIPISLYLGWITIATVANATAVLVDLSINKLLYLSYGLTEVYWTNFMLLVATIITLLMLFIRKDIAYSLVVIWAFVGILTKRISDIPTQLEIITTSAIGIGLILVMIGYITYKLIKKKS